MCLESGECPPSDYFHHTGNTHEDLRYEYYRAYKCGGTCDGQSMSECDFSLDIPQDKCERAGTNSPCNGKKCKVSFWCDCENSRWSMCDGDCDGYKRRNNAGCSEKRTGAFCKKWRS